MGGVWGGVLGGEGVTSRGFPVTSFGAYKNTIFISYNLKCQLIFGVCCAAGKQDKGELTRRGRKERA